MLSEVEKLPLVSREAVLAAWARERSEVFPSTSLVFTLMDFLLNSRLYSKAALAALALINKRFAENH